MAAAAIDRYLPPAEPTAANLQQRIPHDAISVVWGFAMQTGDCTDHFHSTLLSLVFVKLTLVRRLRARA